MAGLDAWDWIGDADGYRVLAVAAVRSTLLLLYHRYSFMTRDLALLRKE